MRTATKIGLITLVLAVLVLVSGTGTALANECMSIGEIGTQCGCPGGWYCG